MPATPTVVINAAGLGSRMGLGIPKSLIKIHGKTIIHRQLELLEEAEDVRVVVGFKKELVMEEVLRHRKDVVFVINHDYPKTGTLKSLYLGSRHTNRRILSLDGDLLVSGQDLSKFIRYETELLGVSRTYTEEPVCCKIERRDQMLFLKAFSEDERTDYEWTGLALLDQNHIPDSASHVYQALECILPLPCLEIQCKEIDTPNDLDKAMEWVHDQRS